MGDEQFDAVLAGWLVPTQLGEKELAKSYPERVRKLAAANPADAKLRRLYDDLVAENYNQADAKLKAGVQDAVDTMLDIMNDLTVDPGTRLRAATYVFERMRGKTPDVVVHSQDKPFQVVMQRITAGPRPQVVEGTVVDQLEITEAEVVNGHETRALRHLQEEQAFIVEWRKSNLGSTGIDGDSATAEFGNGTGHLSRGE